MNCKLIFDVAVFDNDHGKILLVKYKDGNKYDHQKGWFLPDDLIKEFEHPDDSAIRVLKDQLGIDAGEVKLSFIESFQGNDKSWHLVFHYKTHLPATSSILPSAEIENAEWFDLKNLPDKKEVAHQGWALYTLEELTK